MSWEQWQNEIGKIKQKINKTENIDFFVLTKDWVNPLKKKICEENLL